MAKHGERGVTLLELLVAMTLLAVVLVGLAASYPLAMVGVSIGGFRTTATLLAGQCMELAKDLVRNGNLTQTNLETACPTTTPFGPRFTRSVEVIAGDSLPGGEGESLTATVQVVTITVNFPTDTGIQPLRVRTVLTAGM
jgi:prepilin-type N-terminal cleavage/methylation domain-containing protein